MKLGPEPMPVIRAQSIALTELGGIGIPGNNLEDEPMDRR
jgi:hypothetical protein